MQTFTQPTLPSRTILLHSNGLISDGFDKTTKTLSLPHWMFVDAQLSVVIGWSMWSVSFSPRVSAEVVTLRAEHSNERGGSVKTDQARSEASIGTSNSRGVVESWKQQTSHPCQVSIEARSVLSHN